uniref:Tudor domain-containing protein n=1 Tax=Cyprinodon variegatus TaxID=28743 RepID=A0A3Q2FCN7_CYPVA
MTYTATTSKLAWGKKEHFLLHPEVELCILANVLPRSSENRWSPVALEFLKSFTGKLVDAHVQDVLVPDRMFLLDIPCISKQMCEMGFAKKLAPVTFKDFLLMSLKSVSGAEVKIRILPPEFKRMPQLGLKCTLAGVRPQGRKWSQSALDYFVRAVTDKTLEVHVVGKSSDGYVVTLRDPNTQGEQDVGAQLSCNGLAERTDVRRKPIVEVGVRPLDISTAQLTGSGVPVQKEGEKSVKPTFDLHNNKRKVGTFKEQIFPIGNLPPKSIASGTAVDVYVSHCNSPLSFFVQYINKEDELFSLVEKLNEPESMSKANIIEDVHPGDLLKAEFVDDGSWYRAVVKETQENATALVEFIDFGNTAVIPFSKMEKLPKSHLLFPAYSTHCMLSDAAQVGSVWEVRLEDKKNESETPALLPCTPGYPFHKEMLVGQQLEVYIMSVNEDSTFWCQSADSQELSKVTSDVSEVWDTADTYSTPNALSLGMSCLALFADDQLWYRAEVVDKNEDKVSVLFVDYGNTSQVSIKDIRAVPPALLEVPPQAFLCELEGFDTSIGSWSDGAANELFSITEDKLLRIVQKSSTAELDLVHLALILVNWGERDI